MFVLVTMNLTENSLLPHFHSSRCKFYRKNWNMSAGRWCCNTGWELYFAIVFFSGFIIMAWSVSPVCSHKVFDRGTGWEIKSGKEFIHGGRMLPETPSAWDILAVLPNSVLRLFESVIFHITKTDLSLLNVLSVFTVSDGFGWMWWFDLSYPNISKQLTYSVWCAASFWIKCSGASHWKGLIYLSVKE